MDVEIYRSKPEIVKVIKWKDYYWENEKIMSQIEEFCGFYYFLKKDIKDGDYLVKDLFENVAIVDEKEFLKHYEYVAKLADSKME